MFFIKFNLLNNLKYVIYFKIKAKYICEIKYLKEI